MRARAAILGALLVTCSCRESSRSSSDSRVDPNAIGAPSSDKKGLDVTALARAIDRFQGIAFEPTYVYFSAMFHGSRRVPKLGGPIEIIYGQRVARNS